MRSFYFFIIFILCVDSFFCKPGDIIKSISLDLNFQTGITFEKGNLWVCDREKDSIYCYNMKEQKIVKSIPSPQYWPVGLTFDGKYLWNCDRKTGKAYQLDMDNGDILKSLELPVSSPAGIAWDGNTLWVAGEKNGKIYKIDLSDGTGIMEIPVPVKYCSGLVYDGNYLWAADRMNDELFMLSPRDGSVILITDSPGPFPSDICYDGEYFWITDYESDSVYQVVRKDEEAYSLNNIRKTKLTAVHQVKALDQGGIKKLNVNIAVPDHLVWQRIISVDYSPSTGIMKTDRWGQKVKSFLYHDIPKDSLIETRMVVEADLYDIRYYIFPEECGTLRDIPTEIMKEYTADGTKYDIQNPFIQETVKRITGKETNPYWIMRHIFDYVRNTLEYELVGGWNSAPVVLKRKTGSCSEYSFSFISLCRAAGLPARYTGAYVVRGDDESMDDVFHRWPEVYLPHYGWIPVDPQGGDKETPREQALNIGSLSNRFLITTIGGGDSEYLGWYYNSYETTTASPKTQIHIETFADWQKRD